jgi:hypothetical protein
VDLFTDKEKSLLTPLPVIDYDTRIIRTVKSTTQALVKFDTSRYSVPFAYASRTLTLNPTSCLFAILGIKHVHFSIVIHVISIG